VTSETAGNDDLDTINYNGGIGDILVVQATNSTHDIVLKDGTGNLKLTGDLTLDNVEDAAMLVWSTGSVWRQVGFASNGA
jgi:hypothetical protein